MKGAEDCFGGFVTLPLIRFLLTTVMMAVMAFCEIMWQKRPLQNPRFVRWVGNVSIQVVNAAMMSFFTSVGALSAAAFAEDFNIGLLNLLVLPFWLRCLIAVVCMDLIIYFQHRMFHFVPALWRVHGVHHADTDLDFSSGLRFHPLEILVSAIIKTVSVLLLGIPVLAILIFEIILNLAALFNHSNIYIPKRIDRKLRRILVTPDMHRVHHSVAPIEINRNFGFCLSCWDQWFGSYLARPLAGHQKMKIGLSKLQGQGKVLKLNWMLKAPFSSDLKS